MRNSRYALMEAILEIYGALLRVHLQRAFGIAPAAATRLIAAYREAHPDAITFNTVEKRYMKGNAFQLSELAKFNVTPQTFYDAACVMAGEPIVLIDSRIN